MTTPEIPMDALRRYAYGEANATDVEAIRAYVRAVDEAQNKGRDEALALLIINSVWSESFRTYEEAADAYNVSAPIALKAAPQIRAHIEGERAS